MKNYPVSVASGFRIRGIFLPWWLPAIVVLLGDVTSKLVVSGLIQYGESIPVTGFFNLVHVWNFGAAFSFLADAGGWQRFFFLGLTFFVVLWIVVEMRKPMPVVQMLAYSLILGGALGNAVDRLFRGYVVDYLDFHVVGWHWPSFNFADISIFFGAAFLILTGLRVGHENGKERVD